MALGETAELAVRLTLDDKFSRGLRGATGSLGKFEGSIRRVGRGTGQLASGLTRVGTVAGTVAAGGLIGAAKAAIDWESAFAGVQKTVDESALLAVGLSYDKLGRSIRDMATEIPISAVELAGLAETAGALGIKAQDIEEFTRVTALMGVTTNVSAADAADAFGRIGTILGLTGDDYEELADSIVALGNSGASTEAEIIEITKRFAAEAKSAGILKEEIVGLASVTASLGFAPERGGTALARVFANMGTNIALANDKGKAFAKLVGEPLGDLQDKIDRGEGLPIFLDVLKEIKGLSKTDADRTLAALGITNVSDRTIFRAMADQLPEVIRQLELAGDATGALSKEAQTRFNTVASKITTFKNGLIEAGITIGEGMIPAIGRATEKLSEFLKAPGGKSELKALGEDIGRAIDGINWAEVVAGGREVVGLLKTGAGFAKTLLDAFMALPGEIKAAAAGLLILNKASGGLVGAGLGNIAGGIAEAVTRSLGSRLPGVGRLFAQPVFVTNWPMTFGGGGPDLPGGNKPGGFSWKNLLRDGIKFVIPVAVGIAIANALREAAGISPEEAERRNSLGQFGPRSPRNVPVPVEVKNLPRQPSGDPRLQPQPRETNSGDPRLNPRAVLDAKVRADIAATKANTAATVLAAHGVRERQDSASARIQSAIIATSNARAAAEARQAMDAKIIAANVSRTGAEQKTAIAAAGTRVQTSVQIMGLTMAVAQASAATRSVIATVGAASRTVNATLTGSSRVASAQHSGASRIVSAIWAARPVINTTTIQQRTTITNSYGPTGGSSTTNRIPGSGR